MTTDYDVIVVGAGHAGIEAVAAAARLGCRAALVTQDTAAIGRMSCNPAIGGVGKGQIVREIDALGGLMGLAADATAIQFRMLNRSKGKAVWGPRCQSDRHAYEAFAKQALAAMPGVSVLTGEVVAILTAGGSTGGVRLADETDVTGRTVILTTGTFLRGVLHRGERTWPGGRIDEPSAGQLSESLRNLGIELGRLKTGTCARIAAESIDYSRCDRQDGDAEPQAFSILTGKLAFDQTPCWITRTNADVHRIIREAFAKAPMFTGQITAVGPRYCPSIETKIERFSDRDSHQLFLEPEGRTTNSVYINGLATSLPTDVQDRILHGIDGLADAEVLRYGYAIEYDYAAPTQLQPTLETKAMPGLFLAGQINGTTGYEEAAGQGLIAGTNAAAAIAGSDPIILRRDQAYIGVMIDDLVTKGVTEPYRMFTSRAEFRLQLRADNANERLAQTAASLGLLSPEHTRATAELTEATEAIRNLLAAIRLDGKSLRQTLANPNVTLVDLLRRLADSPETNALAQRAANATMAAEMVVTDCRYAGYVERQQRQARQIGSLDAQKIPDGVDFAAVPHLRHEAMESLNSIRPRTLGQALRISGITPADIAVLSIHIHARK